MENSLEKTFNDIVDIQNTSGNDKKTLTASLMDKNKSLCDLIFILVDKFTVTNLSTKKINKKVSVNNYTQINDFTEYLYYIGHEVKGDDVSIKSVQHYIESTDEKYHDFLKKIATKTLNIGIQLKSYNNIANNLGLPVAKDFKVQLATGINNIKNFNPQEDFYVTEKLDGIRCIASLNAETSNIEFYARSGKPIDGLTEIRDELSELSELFHLHGMFNYVLDGELLSQDQSDKAEDTFRDTAGKVGSKGEKTGLVFNIFDVLTDVEFFGDKVSQNYSERRDILRSLNVLTDSMEHVSILPVIYKGKDLDKVYELLDEYVSNGSEGLMINLNAPYELKRTKTLIKIKQCYSNDGIIKGFYEGKGEFEGTLGGAYITYKDIVVKVGSGFKAHEREEIWNNQDKYIGKLAEYKFTSESNDNDGNLKDLRFARWVGLREDKNEVSYDN